MKITFEVKKDGTIKYASSGRPNNQNSDLVRSKVAILLKQLDESKRMAITPLHHKFIKDVAAQEKKPRNKTVDALSKQYEKINARPKYHMAHHISISHLINNVIYRLNNPGRTPEQEKKDNKFLDALLSPSDKTRLKMEDYLKIISGHGNPVEKACAAEEFLWNANAQKSNLIPGYSGPNISIGGYEDTPLLEKKDKEGKPQYNPDGTPRLVQPRYSRKLLQAADGFCHIPIAPKTKKAANGHIHFQSSSVNEKPTDSYASFSQESSGTPSSKQRKESKCSGSQRDDDKSLSSLMECESAICVVTPGSSHNESDMKLLTSQETSFASSEDHKIIPRHERWKKERAQYCKKENKPINKARKHQQKESPRSASMTMEGTGVQENINLDVLTSNLFLENRTNEKRKLLFGCSVSLFKSPMPTTNNNSFTGNQFNKKNTRFNSNDLTLSTSDIWEPNAESYNNINDGLSLSRNKNLTNNEKRNFHLPKDFFSQYKTQESLKIMLFPSNSLAENRSMQSQIKNTEQTEPVDSQFYSTFINKYWG